MNDFLFSISPTVTLRNNENNYYKDFCLYKKTGERKVCEKLGKFFGLTLIV